MSEAAYYLRLMSMYIDLGTEVVLKVFTHHTPGKDAETFLLSNTSRLQQLKNRQIINKQESDLVLASTPNPEAFDVSLLITLSINLFSEKQLPSPRKGWLHPPKESDTSISADLLHLRTVRNLIVCHRAKAQLPEWRFKDEWDNVVEIFLRIYRDIAPGEESDLKQRIEDYRLRKLDPSIENKYDSKLHEWQQQISEIQQQVEDALKTVDDIDKYLKSKSDRYERYIKLLVKGGRYVILALIEDNLKKQNRNLRDILKDKEDYVRNSIDNRDHLHILYPPDQGNTSDPIDMSTWDITLLATLLLQILDSSSLDDEVIQAINNINTARKNYAEAAVVSLDSDAFAEYSYPLKYSIQFLSRYFDTQKKDECEAILSECKTISRSDSARQTYFDELKKQSMKIKSIHEIYKDKIKETKHVLQEMITHGIEFKKEHVLELKMITLGCEEEKKQLGENVLTDIWREALERSGDSTDFDVVKKEVLKILTGIRKPNGVKGIDVKQECIFLGITCSSVCTLLDLLNYFESSEFNQSLRNISSELGHLFNTIFAIQGNVTLESLEDVLTDSEQQNRKDKGISMPITVTSPAAVVQLKSFFKSEAMVNSTNAIADKLSVYLEETVTLEVSHDKGLLNRLFDDIETKYSSSDSLSGDTEHEIEPEYDSGGKTDVNQRICTADIKAMASSEEANRTALDFYMQQKEDNTIKRKQRLQPENKKYRNWVRAGLGIKYVKEGLEPFCDHFVNQQHIAILDKVKRKHNLSAVACRRCNVRTLQPDHVHTKTRQCPLGQIYCNCLHPRGKIPCPNNVCGAIYDEVIQLHASTPPAPNWKNTDAQQWCTEPWAVAKCFINTPGYEAKKNRAAEFDCLSLLHVLINNFDFQQHIKCVITGTDVFSRVRKSTNAIFHSKNMELEDAEVNNYIDDVIELFEDETEIKHRQESLNAVKKLVELKQDDFIISTKHEAEIHRIAMAAINEKERELETMVVDAGNKLRNTATEGKRELGDKGLDIKSELEKTGQNIQKKLVVREDTIKTAATEGIDDIAGKVLDIRSKLEETGQNIRKELVMKEDEIRTAASEGKSDIEGKALDIKAELVQTEKIVERKITQIKIQVPMKGVETEENLKQKRQESQLELDHKHKFILDDLEQKYPSQSGSESRNPVMDRKSLTDGPKTDDTDSKQEAENSKKKAGLLNMEHQAQLANVKYRNWVRAGLGIKYVKEGLEPFCDHLATQQHKDILNKVKHSRTISAVSCGHCNVRTLQPNHVRTRNKQCPLGQINCNCQYPGGKTLCPNNVCGAIYDETIQLHASTPPAPNWKNTDARQWCTEPWSIAKCFIKAPGYEHKTKASEFDCPGLLHLLINNKGFQQHIKCAITGTDVFSRVRTSRNAIFHSHTMELEDNEVNSCIDDMIELLEDETELKHRPESKDAVINLKKLKQEDFIISTTDEAEIRRVAMAAINEKERELQQTILVAGNDFRTAAAEEKGKLEGKGLVIKSEHEQTRMDIRKVLVMKTDEIRTTANEGKRMLEQEGLAIKTNLQQTGEQKRIEIENQLTAKTVEAEQIIELKLQESKLELESVKNLSEDLIAGKPQTRQEAENSKAKTVKPSSLDHLTSSDLEIESAVADDDFLQILLNDEPEQKNGKSKEGVAHASSCTPTWDLDNTCMRLGMSSENIVLAFAAVKNYHEKTPVLVCLTKTKCTKVPEEFEGFRVLQKPFYPSSKESLEAENSVYSNIRGKKYNKLFKKINHINETIAFHADKLFHKHTNLEAIRLSLVRATRLGFRKRPCIVLVCRCKSYIPFGESEFPTELRHPKQNFTFKTDVREGYFILCVNGNVITRYAKEWNQELAMGCSIGPENVRLSASIGPFVTVKETKETCLLTVRHVFQPLDKPSDQIVGTNVVQPADGDLSRQIQIPKRWCGAVKVAEINERIDAALVSICPERIPSRGNFVDVTIDDLDSAGLSVHQYPIYDDGSMKDATQFTANDFLYDRIIKFGKESGLRKGTLRISNMAAKVVTGIGSIYHDGLPQNHILTGQLQVDSHADKTFCQKGDSGSAVFYVDREHRLHCIGIVTGTMSDLICVVTPIQPILEGLGKKINKTLELTSFVHEDMEI